MTWSLPRRYLELRNQGRRGNQTGSEPANCLGGKLARFGPPWRSPKGTQSDPKARSREPPGVVLERNKKKGPEKTVFEANGRRSEHMKKRMSAG